jgi:hypothetical protein
MTIDWTYQCRVERQGNLKLAVNGPYGGLAEPPDTALLYQRAL